MGDSLLVLLKKEDSLAKEVALYRDTYASLKECNGNTMLVSEYKMKTEESYRSLLECRKEISQYLNFLKV